MKAWKPDHRKLGWIFALSVALHLGFLLVPLSRQVMESGIERSPVQVQLVRNPVIVQQSPPSDPLINPMKPETTTPEDLPPPPVIQPNLPPTEVVQSEIPVMDEMQPPTPQTGRRLLSSQFDLERAVQDPLFESRENIEEKPDFYFRQRASLEKALNEPSLQLPFEDTRIYLVDSYDDGFIGGMDKFWDSVSVPFGFTTKNNTRVECVWVLVFAGCGWGHTSLFYQPAKRREKQDKQAES